MQPIRPRSSNDAPHPVGPSLTRVVLGSAMALGLVLALTLGVFIYYALL